ncbi:MAG: hypothetical protein KFW21_00635 [Spirochaetota bacterium]|nr:hypothetical protein [Spirochaetota bacterium]
MGDLFYREYYRFGEKKHLEDLINGQLYCNTLQYFQKIENDAERGDFDEGNKIILRPYLDPDSSIITYEDPIVGKISLSNEDIREINFSSGNDPSHIFCMSYFEIDQDNPPEQIEILNLFNTNTVIFYNHQLIINIMESLRKCGIHYRAQIVKYEDYSTTPYCKKK